MLKQKLLNDAFVSHRLIAFRTPTEKWGETIVGYIKEITSENITIDEINEYGCPIGTSTFKLKSLIDIVLDDKTLKCLKLMEDYGNQFSLQKCTTVWGKGYELKEYIKNKMKEKETITLFVEDGVDDDTNIIGIVEDIDQKSVLVNLIDRYGERDGTILIPLETITGIRWGSMENQARWMLNEIFKNGEKNKVL